MYPKNLFPVVGVRSSVALKLGCPAQGRFFCLSPVVLRLDRTRGLDEIGLDLEHRPLKRNKTTVAS